ncbi:MAG: hypothetical protein ABH840_04640 [Nanoarchaeota archaeon]
MKKRGVMALLLVLVFFTILLYASLTVADQVRYLNVSATIETPELRIEIPDSINLGNVYPGYEGGWVSFNISNTGEVDAIITAELEFEDDELFRNVCLRDSKPSCSTGDWEDCSCTFLSYNLTKFDMDLNRPDKLGEVTSETIYSKLYLVKYNGTEYGKRSARIKFIAMAK